MVVRQCRWHSGGSIPHSSSVFLVCDAPRGVQRRQARDFAVRRRLLLMAVVGCGPAGCEPVRRGGCRDA